MGKITLNLRTEVSQLYKSLVGFKYNLHEAISDLCDNSVDAEASIIYINVSSKEIVIADDGSGMNRDQLELAMTPWANTQKFRKGKLGLHGIGLKAAAFSLGGKLEVHTRSSNKNFFCVKIVAEEMQAKEDKSIIAEDEVSELYRKFNFKTGTVIRIADVKTRKTTQVAIEALKSQIGMMFFRLIENKKVTILVNDQKVVPMSPLLPDLDKGSPKNFYHYYGTKNLKYEKDNGEIANITLRAAHIGRANFWSNNDRTKYRFFLKKKVDENNELSSGLLKLDDQGVYVMRNERLIKLGGDYLGIVRSTSLLHHDTCLRILLEYDSKDDDLIGVDHTKTKPDLDLGLKDALRDFWFKFLTTDSDERFRKENVAVEAEVQKRADKELKDRAMASPKGVKSDYDASMKFDNIAPGRAKKNKADETKIKIESKKKQEWFELCNELPYNNLWQGEKNKDNDIIVYVNEKNQGYGHLYLEKEPNLRRKNLNFLFYCMAIFEVDIADFIKGAKPSELELLKKAFKEFRKFVSRQVDRSDSK